MTIDSTYYYRLTNSRFTDKALEVIAEYPHSTIGVDQAKPYTGQYWKFVGPPGQAYKLVTAYAGDRSPLIGADPPRLGADGDPSNQQQWTLTQSDNTWTLTQSGKQLGIAQQGQTYRVLLQPPSDQAAFRWTLTPLTPVKDVIPDLNLKEQTVLMTLGPTDYDLCIKPTGTVKGVMVFVDFENAQVTTGTDWQTLPVSIANRLLGANNETELKKGNYKVRNQLSKLSYGKLTLDVTVRSELGWRRMSRPDNSPADQLPNLDYPMNIGVKRERWRGKTASEVGEVLFTEKKRFFEKAAQLFPEITFSEYQFVCIVTPQSAGFNSLAFLPGSPAQLASLASAAIKRGWVLGMPIYTVDDPDVVISHELGHLFGLPDLYPIMKDKENKAGDWSIMSDGWHSTRYLGWERHKLGWLDPSRTTYLSQSPLTLYPDSVDLKTGFDPLATYCLQLSPLSSDSGLSMIVLPLDDASRPSKVLVVELAQPFKGADATNPGEGVLLYTVDATISGGDSPIEIVPQTISESPRFGRLYQAPFNPGDPAKTFKRGNVSITVEVLEKIGSSYKISIDRKYAVRSRITEFSQGLTSGSVPSDITLGPDGNLWFTENAGNRIGRIDSKTGVITEFSQGLTPGSNPGGITTGPDGNLWFVENAGNRIGRITPGDDIPTASRITEFSQGLTPGSNPGGITTGPDGNLWFTESAGNRIGRISPAGIITSGDEFTLPTAGSAPHSITAGPDGNLWFTENSGNRIGRIDPKTGVITEFPLPTPGSQPADITTGLDGNLWFTEVAGNRIGCIDPKTGVITEFPLPTPGSQPANITTGPDGNLWFTEFNGNNIGCITTSGLITEFRVPTASSFPGGITAGLDGDLWFTENAGNRIGRITTSVVITEFRVPTANSFPGGITAGLDGNLWFTENSGNRIGRITTSGLITEFRVPTANSQPVDITAGPDGNLWFTESQGNQIGRISPAGVITEFRVPTPDSLPMDITLGPDGNLWFTESQGNQIGRITPGDNIPPDGRFQEFDFPVPTPGSSSAALPLAAESSGITKGPDGSLWFTEYGRNNIGRISPGGDITEFPLPRAASLLMGITLGPDGNLWFTERQGNKIGRITPGDNILPESRITEFPLPTANSQPFGITAGPDGNLWFTERQGNQIGRISPAGVITEFRVPTPDSRPYNITLGLDGNLWFTESQGNKIGRISGLGCW